MKLTKPAILQILFNLLMVCWVLALVFQTNWLFWLPMGIILPLMIAVVCWGTIKLKREKP